MDTKEFLPGLIELTKQLSDDEIREFFSDVKANVAASQKHFINAYLAASSILVAHYLLTRDAVDSVSVLGNHISRSDGLATLLLSAGSVLFTLSVSSEYALRWYRETYDYGSTIKNRLLSRLGFHDFRVSSYPLSGVELLMHHGPKFSRVIGVVYRAVMVFLLFTLPTGYLITEALKAVRSLNFFDSPVEMVLLCFSLALSALNILVVVGSMQIANVDALTSHKVQQSVSR